MTTAQTPLITLHIVAAGAALPLGLWQSFGRKGNTRHVVVGVLWTALMAVAILSSFGIGGGPSWIHALSILAGTSLVTGLWHLRQRRGPRHGSAMRGALIGLWVAFAFTLLPGRTIHLWLFG